MLLHQMRIWDPEEWFTSLHSLPQSLLPSSWRGSSASSRVALSSSKREPDLLQSVVFAASECVLFTALMKARGWLQRSMVS